MRRWRACLRGARVHRPASPDVLFWRVGGPCPLHEAAMRLPRVWVRAPGRGDVWTCAAKGMAWWVSSKLLEFLASSPCVCKIPRKEAASYNPALSSRLLRRSSRSLTRDVSQLQSSPGRCETRRLERSRRQRGRDASHVDMSRMSRMRQRFDLQSWPLGSA